MSQSVALNLRDGGRDGQDGSEVRLALHYEGNCETITVTGRHAGSTHTAIHITSRPLQSRHRDGADGRG